MKHENRDPVGKFSVIFMLGIMEFPLTQSYRMAHAGKPGRLYKRKEACIHIKVVSHHHNGPEMKRFEVEGNAISRT